MSQNPLIRDTLIARTKHVNVWYKVATPDNEPHLLFVRKRWEDAESAYPSDRFRLLVRFVVHVLDDCTIIEERAGKILVKDKGVCQADARKRKRIGFRALHAFSGKFDFNVLPDHIRPKT